MKGFINAFIIGTHAWLTEELKCDVCPTIANPETGCFHNGNVYCSEHLLACVECKAAAYDDWQEDRR